MIKTSFKFLAVGALAVFSLQSCEKKNQAADQLEPGTESPAMTEMAPATAPNNEMLTAASSDKPLTNIAISENTFDFGNIKKGDVKSHTYEVTNTGTNPLIISEVKPGCGCTVPEFTKDPILPGQKGMVTLKFESAGFEGAVSKSAQIFANVEKAPITIGFTANIN